ncbi:hypothetical protein AB0K68_24970 [Streptomyces sp. NPDC050698]
MALTATVTGVLALGAPVVALAAADTGVAAASPGSATSTDVSAKPTQSQWTQLNHVATTHSVLGLADSGTVLRLAAGTSAQEKTRVKTQLSANTQTSVRVSQFSKDDLSKIQKTVTSRKWNSDADKYGVAASYDAKADKVTVLTDAPASVTNPLRSAYPGAVEIQPARLEPQQNRFSDVQPFWGGMALTGSNGTQAFNCTAGFAVRQRATGHVYMTTAGHCYSNLAYAFGRNQNGTFNSTLVGQVTRRDRNIDTELIADVNRYAHPYDSYMWAGGTAGSGTAVFVHGTERPELNRRVCVSGSVTFNHCGHPISDTRFSVCYSGGADCIKDGKGFLYERGGTNFPAFDNGNVTRPGDSGAPIYTTDDTESGAWIVGGHSGGTILGGGPCHCSRELMVGVNIEAIKQDMGVDVVTR